MTDKLKRYKYPYKKYFVRWDDAVMNAGWFEGDLADEWMKNKSSHIAEEVGFLIAEDDKAIFLAGRILPETEDNEEFLGSLHRIPRNWILKKRLYGSNE